MTYFVIHGGHVLPLTKISRKEMAAARRKFGTALVAIPVHWSEDGVWPSPAPGCIVVQQVNPGTLKP